MTARFFSKAGSATLLGLLLILAAPSAAIAKTSKKKSTSKNKNSRSTAAKLGTALAKTAKSADVPFSTVVLDAGHGGHDPGGIPSNLIPEKGVALDVTLRVAAHLRSAGINVVLTRSDDTFVSLPDRVKVANQHPEGIFVSIHFNSGERVAARGIETFYSDPSGAPLAARVQSNLMSVTDGENRGVKRASFYVLRHAKIRSILAECGFLTNPEDAARASSRIGKLGMTVFL
ncbi:MAG: N-acetylmuramoyl-L-alanine amidase [Verrucomicrobiaceae bacterium]|nr:MAG: N-acetylmuramoyl-L-alanine amidase [Verrucomicrobiaceae bacterium]